MAGLGLNVGGYGSGFAGASLPVASNMPTGTTVNQAAFGISSTGGPTGPRTAGLGTVALGVAGAVVLTWLWYTLPR